MDFCYLLLHSSDHSFHAAGRGSGLEFRSLGSKQAAPLDADDMNPAFTGRLVK
ncbi:MAG: hypothetical protein KGI29_08530 [Pseudomonadota bacterium]|nr:hypothetical protein [Pseudomonadota bacterium]MDE3037162.1 hypothetical protein [Pseudomonadota bacterium]